jgi:hypothetical protein
VAAFKALTLGAKLAKDPLPLQQSAQRGADAALLLDHPLFQEMIAAQIEAVTSTLMSVGVAEHEERLALCTVLRVLRGFKAGLEQIKSSGSFDAAQLAKLNKDNVNG